MAEGRGVNVEEARWLLMNLQKFYGMADGSGKRARLLKMFSEGDEGFSVDELVEEVGKVD